jgi:hypothetical protein
MIAQNTRICAQPAKVMDASEFFGFDEGVDEIDGEKRHHAAAKQIVDDHDALLQPVAGDDIKGGGGKQPDADAEHRNLKHGVLQIFPSSWLRIEDQRNRI